jgi:peptidoglycan/xylan/chitin deacetylase (PgdA/CDA1 family)
VRFAIPLFAILFLLAAIALTTGRPSPRLAPPDVLIASASARDDNNAVVITPTLTVPTMPMITSSSAPAATFTAAAPGQRPYVPILMYHYVRNVDQAADPLGYSLSVTPEQLAAQLDWLRRAGYDTVPISALAACMAEQAPCPARAVALTFDDGHMDAYTAALPLLKQYNATATFYIVSGFVGKTSYMGWDEIRALHNAGMEIGAHSISHLDLTTLSYYENVDQIARSGQEIAAQIGQPIRSFCYPAGQFNAEIAKITRDAGYTSATTTIQEGPQNDPFTLPRLRIYGDMSLEGFQNTVSAYLP